MAPEKSSSGPTMEITCSIPWGISDEDLKQKVESATQSSEIPIQCKMSSFLKYFRRKITFSLLAAHYQEFQKKFGSIPELGMAA